MTKPKKKPERDIEKHYTKQQFVAKLRRLAARRSEIFRLQWTDVDFQNSRIRLGTRKRRDGTLEFDWLPVNTELIKQLQWWHGNRAYKDSPYAFERKSDLLTT